MTEKPFYKSKKFIYALSTFLSALILYAWLMLNPDMPQDQVDLLSELILVVLTMGGLLLTGHTVTDVMAVWVNRPQPKPLGDAAHDLIDATPLATTPATNIIVNTTSDKSSEIARVVGEAVSRAQAPSPSLWERYQAYVRECELGGAASPLDYAHWMQQQTEAVASMGRRAITLLLALVALVVVAALLLVQPPAAAQGPETATPNGDRFVAIGVLLWDKELGVEVKVYGGAFGPALPTATPMAATQAPAASDTPLAAATSTPTATLTPSATTTWTLTPTASATASSTPTATVQSPSNTPVPSATSWPTPTPESGIPTLPPATPGKSCQMRWTEATNVRSGPGTDKPKVASIGAGERVQVLSVSAAASGFYWAQTARGWAAFYVVASAAWWVTAEPGQGELCTDLETWPAGLDAPPGSTAWGVLTTVGADKATVQKMIDIVQGAGREPALTVVMDASMAAAFDDQAYVIWRPWPDCPAMLDDVATSVRARLDYIDRVTLHRSFDALQLTNECAWPSPGYLNAWTLEALRQGRARYPGKQIIPWVFAPGTFEPSWVPLIEPALADMAAHGDLFGLNLYPARAGVPLSTRDAWTIWTTWRYEMIRALMEPGANPCFVVTEAGAGDGNMALTPGDATAFAAQIDGDVCAVTLWHLSPADLPGPWPEANLWDRIESVFIILKNN